MRSITQKPKSTRPHRTKPSALASFVAVQFAVVIAIAQMKLMGDLGSCGRCGANLVKCHGCNGGANPGGCSDPACIDGVRCVAGCTSHERGGGGWF